MTYKVELYGRLKDAGFGTTVSLDLPAHTTVRQALAALHSAFGRKANLLKGCVLATSDEVLSASDRLSHGRLALLPPVCGG